MSESQKFGQYGLPLEVKYCKNCTISNQRPSSSIEFKNKSDSFKKSIRFADDGICDACKIAEDKKKINWTERADELSDLCDRFRRTDGRYDVIVPGSGGKDSFVAAHILKNEYKMNPILVTWPPAMYTKTGYNNFQAWLESGYSNYTFHPNKKVHKTLTRLAFLDLCHPFQPFILGQKNLAPRLSAMLDIPLVMYGENEAEYGNPKESMASSQRSSEYFSTDENYDNLFISGQSVSDLIKNFDITLTDLLPYLPVPSETLNHKKTEVHYLGYYKRWHPQEAYYTTVLNSDFRPNMERTEGSYSKYSSLDDKMDWMHFYTTFIKFGIGRATYDSAQEIRNGDITRDEGIRLIRRFDGEFPNKYFRDCLKYMDLSQRDFFDTIEKFRTKHLWEKRYGKWELINPIWKSN